MLNKIQELAIFWFRRDLRLEDNVGLSAALSSGLPVLPLFIFDRDILDKLSETADRRISFIHQALQDMQMRLEHLETGLWVEVGRPIEIFKNLLRKFPVKAVYANRDYEPYARQRDKQIVRLLEGQNIPFYTFKDHVIFEKDEIQTQHGTPYTVFTPYRNRWRERLSMTHLPFSPSQEQLEKLVKHTRRSLPTLKSMGFQSTQQQFPSKMLRKEVLCNYHKTRDFPGIDGTSQLGVHLRFGTISIRQVVRQALEINDVFLNELIWREFFLMILWHFPQIVTEPFREKYHGFPWRHDKADFQRWCEGTTGFPMVDAGMRQLNATGFMHNRVRMITANFLTKLLLIDWRWGEAYFAKKLLDYEQASNIGNWQWSAGCGVDAAPYFRIFNPDAQLKKFDPDLKYVKRWIPEIDRADYPETMVNYRVARQMSLDLFKSFLATSKNRK